MGAAKVDRHGWILQPCLLYFEAGLKF